MTLVIKTPDEKLSELAKPPLEALDKIKINQSDLLVVSAGFEERALAAVKLMLSESDSFELLLIGYEPYIEENKLTILRKLCQNKAVIIDEIIYNRANPEGSWNILNEKFSCYQGNIYIDISAMSRLLIVQILVMLGRRKHSFTNCFIIYSEADEYPPSESEAQKKIESSREDPTRSLFFLSAGVFEVIILKELSIATPTSTQTRLIAFPSFDAHQLNSLRNEIQPSKISVIEGVPPVEKNKWRTKAIHEINHLDQKTQNIEIKQTSTLDYRETLSTLLELYQKYSIHERLVISPTGSKMQTVAVGIFQAFIKDVQIIYPTPATFVRPETYTIGTGPMYLLPLAAFSKLGK
jgi:hypothetical protein